MPAFPSLRSVIKIGISALVLVGATTASATESEDNVNVVVVPANPTPSVPTASTPEARFSRAISSIRSSQWALAQQEIDAIGDRQLASFARAELYLAPRSPRIEGAALQQLLAESPDLPQAQQIARLARLRGISALPSLPEPQRLAWAGGSPRRGNPASVSDPSLGSLPSQLAQRISNDDPAGAEALLSNANGIGAAARTEWQQRIAWSYYIENDDANARRLAAVAQAGVGDWAAQADWTQGLASWRTRDCAAAMQAFSALSARAREPELQAAGHFWFARSATACGRPQDAQPALRRAAAIGETFYGLLAAETLGIRSARDLAADARQSDVRRVSALPNVRAAIALANAGNTDLADQALRHQARIGAASDHAALLDIAASLSLPETQLFLASNAPAGQRPGQSARFPTPQWSPANGWRVNPALLMAHTLQESRFRASVVSPAGAVGLMQVRPGTASDMNISAYGRGLTDPAVNMAMGQAYIEHLRDIPATSGLLPKVIAAYNAGPTPVARWNTEARDNGDPLLWIESLPYWETRGYVGTVLRNLWVYEDQLGTPSGTRAMLAQGQWPRVPTAPQNFSMAAPSMAHGGH